MKDSPRADGTCGICAGEYYVDIQSLMGGYQLPMCLKCFNEYTAYLLKQPMFIKQSFQKSVFGALIDTFESNEQHMALLEEVNKQLLATSAECFLISKHWVEKQQASYKTTGKLLSLVK